jgi:hypothetical protein
MCPGPTAVGTDELLRPLEAGDAVILDVRPGPEYAGGHLPGAIHIPLEELAERLAELPANREIVAVCTHDTESRSEVTKVPWREQNGPGGSHRHRPGSSVTATSRRLTAPTKQNERTDS